MYNLDCSKSALIYEANWHIYELRILTVPGRANMCITVACSQIVTVFIGSCGWGNTNLEHLKQKIVLIQRIVIFRC